MSELCLDDIDLEELYEWDETSTATTTVSSHGDPQTLASVSLASSTSDATLTPGTSNSGHQQKKTPKAKEKKPAFSAKFTEADLLQNSPDILRAAIGKAEEDNKFQMKCGYGPKVKEVTKRLLHLCSTAPSTVFEEYAKEIVGQIGECVCAGEGLISSKAQERIWTKFHKLRTDVNTKKKWVLFCTSVGVRETDIVLSFLFQCLLRTILGHIILNQTAEIEKQMDAPSQHSDHDLQVVRYISGFIPFSLMKKYKKMKSEQARVYTKILKEWQLNDEKNTIAPSFLTYTVTWINLQNRGGLFEVHDDVFRFFMTLERASRNYLQKKEIKKMTNDNVIRMMKTKIAESPTVFKAWKNIMNNEVSTTNLYNAVVLKWIKLRVNAFVKAFNMLKKMEKQASKKGEKSLRKELQR